MGRPNIEALRSIGNFQPTYQWYMSMINPAISLGAADAGEQLNLRAISSSLPKGTNSPEEITIRGLTVYQPGIRKPEGTITLTLIECTSLFVKKLASSWAKACYNIFDGTADIKSDVEAVISLFLLNNKNVEIYKYDLFGCWLTDSDSGGELNEATGLFRPTLTIQYDYYTDEALA